MEQSLTGQQIGRYVIGSALAEGGMGSVYQAFDGDSKEPLALKVLLPQFSGDEEFRTRFKREAETLLALKHPHIIPIYTFNEQDGLLYFVMRLVKGNSLDNLLSRHPFSPIMAWNIVQPVTQALDYAHQKGVIHRDLKAANILIEPTGTGDKRRDHVYLADFGLSKWLGSSTLTKPGVSVGTPHYMSPEQVLARPLTSQTDIYALTVLLYFMLLGKFPYDHRKPQEIAFQHVHNDIPDPRAVHPKFPQPIADILRRGLAKEPGDRFESAIAFATAYKEAMLAASREHCEVHYWTSSVGA